MYKIYLALAVILTASMLCFGQTAGAKGTASGSSATSATGGNAISLGSVTNIQGELQKQIDVKKAQPGDPVVLKTTKAVKQNGETIIPKGTSLIGHVTQVSQQGKGNADSSIGVLFDRLEGNGLSSPITASVLSITNAQTAANLGGSALGDVSGSSSTTASGSGSAGGTGGGGLLGGVGGVGGAVAPVLGTATSAVGGVAGAATQTVGSVASTAGQTVGSTTSGLGQTINGIQISNSLSGSVTGGTTLSAAGKNLKLEKGVTFQLQLSPQAGN